MRTDVRHLRDFYATPLGQAAGRRLEARVRARWPDVRGLRVAGVGYAVPALTPFLGEAERVAALMPATQGVVPWPRQLANVAVQAEEVDWPLPDAMLDRLVLLHALETSEQLRLFLRECWRVLAPGGRLLAIVPNRSGLWALQDGIPFGQGRPYTGRQLRRLLREQMFEPLATERALHLPPVTNRTLLRVSAPLEPLGAWLMPRFGGVLLVEAEKTVAGAVPVRARVRRYLPELGVLPKPEGLPLPGAARREAAAGDPADLPSGGRA
ncbi:MAG: methyltransferase domain-containing protein [Alphaproteobacteria bacterium]|nr:methyltransferase domain-containing protein [Alphaproteobacteria bacterium]MCB9928137.1 methyltransferase domain-containing protein [Alphaproteobacteria bacterium]